MLHADARRNARRDAQGNYVPLSEQDPARWDANAIAEAEALLLRASAMQRIGRYQLEAAAQSVHAARRVNGGIDWRAIVTIYDALLSIAPSPVVTINRAVAIGEAQGAAAGLAALDAVADDPRITQYQPWWAARAALLARSGDIAAAQESYRNAIGLETDPAVRRFLIERYEMLKIV